MYAAQESEKPGPDDIKAWSPTEMQNGSGQGQLANKSHATKIKFSLWNQAYVQVLPTQRWVFNL